MFMLFKILTTRSVIFSIILVPKYILRQNIPNWSRLRGCVLVPMTPYTTTFSLEASQASSNALDINWECHMRTFGTQLQIKEQTLSS